MSATITHGGSDVAGANGNGNGNGHGNGNGDDRPMCGAVLVCGGGIAGIQAALDLSAAGFRVHLVEESPTIGGAMARLDKTFPTGDCATCIISPKLVECIRDYNIDVTTMADVVSLEGEPGHFTVQVRKRPRSVRADKCTGCGDCWTACPVRNTAQVPADFQPAEPLNPADSARLDAILARHEGPGPEKGTVPICRNGPEGASHKWGLSPFPGRVIPVLQEISESYGYLPRNLLEHLAARWGLRVAELLRVASFYDRFDLKPVGRHLVEVCSGTSCHSRRAKALLAKAEKEIGVAAGQTDKSGRFTLRTVRCLGLCALSPAMKVDGQSFGRVNIDRVAEILEQFS